MSEAVGVSYNNRYYLAVNGHCYVADARTKYYSDKDADGSYQYEWWYWDGIPARVLCELRGALYFGTQDGRICVFDEQRCDRSHVDIEEGELTVDVPNHQLEYKSLAEREGDHIVIDTDGLYALYASGFERIDGERICVDEESILSMSDGTVVYADEVGESGLSVGDAYVIDDVDAGSCSFRLLDANGEDVKPTSTDFRLHLPLSGRELVICEVTGCYFRVKLWEGGAVLALSAYDGEVPSKPVGRLLHKKKITALWQSGTFDLGSASHAKTLLSISVTAEPGVNSCMSFGYVTRREIREYERSMTTGKFRLDDLSFREFVFSTGFAQSCTKRIFERGINYIAFRVRSEDGDCALGALEAIYKYNGYQGGIR